MANPSKNKGDRGEREFVAHVQERYGCLVRPDAQRLLGAGRKDDEGDVRVLYGAATQVKNYGSVSTALLDAADGAARQRKNARLPLGFGVVKVPYARPPKPVWLACALEDQWLVPVGPDVPVFAMSGRLVTWLSSQKDPATVATARARATTKTQRSKLPPLPVADPTMRVARWRVRGRVLVVAPLEAWIAAYEPMHAEMVHRFGPRETGAAGSLPTRHTSMQTTPVLPDPEESRRADRSAPAVVDVRV